MERDVLCRLCASKGNASADMIYLYDGSLECTSLRQKIEKYTPVKLKCKEDEKLSQHVCTTCSDLVHKWHTFCQLCEHAEQILLARLHSQPMEKATEINQSVQQTEVEQKKTKSRYSYCVAKWCNSNNINCPNMFRLPKGSRGKEWLERADRKDLLDLQPHQLTRRHLCSKHFTKESFIRPNKLTWNAVPTIFKTHRLVNNKKGNSSVTSLPDQCNADIKLQEKWRPVLPAPKKIETVAGDAECANIRRMDGISENTTKKMSSLEVQTQLLQPEATASIQYVSVEDILRGYGNSSFTPVTLTVEPCGLQKGVDQITDGLVTTGIQLQSADNIDSGFFLNDLIEKYTEKCDEILCSGSTEEETKQIEVCVTKPTTSEDNVNCFLLQATSENDTVGTSELSVCHDSNDIKEKDSNREGLEILNELESLYSEQSFQESMLPCSACGEVFLMKSSLLHHQKRYHTEHFEANSMS